MLDIYAEYIDAIPGINLHYLKRYIRFVTSFDRKTKSFGLESHHILIESIFPQYDSPSKYPSNRSILSGREHLIAHKILFKAAKFNKKVSAAWVMLANSHKSQLTSREFESARLVNRQLQLGKVSVRNTLTNEFERVYKHAMQDHHVSMFTDRVAYWSTNEQRVLMLYEWDVIPEGYVKGHDPDQFRKQTLGMNWFYNPNDPSEYKLCIERDVPSGWVKGNPTNDCAGRVWVNNGVEEKMVFDDGIDGWDLGRLNASVSHFKECYYHSVDANESGRFIEGEQPLGWVRGSAMSFYYNPITMERKRFNTNDAPKDWVKGYAATFYYNPKTLEFKRFTTGTQPNGWLQGQSPKTHEVKQVSTYIENRPKLECPHCKKTIAVNTAKRWHFDNCKTRQP